MKKAILIFLLCFYCGKCYLQEEEALSNYPVLYDKTTGLTPVEFNRDHIDTYKNQEEFEYLTTAESDNWWSRFKRWINLKYRQFLNWLFGDYSPNSFVGFLIEVIPFILLLLFLGLLIWLFSRLNPGERILRSPRQNEVFFSEEEELVKNEDLPSLIKKAIQNGEFRLAVRYYYLNELRKLDELHFIKYEYQKTNKDYSEEIKDKTLRKHFFEITKLYEFIWYGSFQVSETDFKLVEKGFIRMEKVLNATGNE